jgi:hypothetical protein
MNHHTNTFFTVDINTSDASVRVNGYKNYQQNDAPASVSPFLFRT